MQPVWLMTNAAMVRIVPVVRIVVTRSILTRMPDVRASEIGRFSGRFQTFERASGAWTESVRHAVRERDVRPRREGADHNRTHSDGDS